MATRTRSAVTFDIEPELLAQLSAEADSNFESNPEAVRRIIVAYFANKVNAPAEVVEDPNGKAALQRRKQLAEVQAIERKNAEATGELIPQAVALEEHLRAMTPVRQAIQQVGGAVDGLTDEQRAQLAKWTEDTLTNLSGGNA
jgi:hypothetical protein